MSGTASLPCRYPVWRVALRCGWVWVGSEVTRLIVLRGNSGSGKSTVAKALREAYGGRGVAWVAQDIIRRQDHCGHSHFYYLDVSMEETFRRHATRPQASEFGPDDMRGWYRPRDLLSSVPERIIPETSTPVETIDTILAESQLLAVRQSRSRQGGSAK